MSKRKTNHTLKAIEAAEKQFASAKSQLYVRVKHELRQLKQNREAIENCFNARKTERERKASKQFSNSMAKAQAHLKTMKTNFAKHTQLADPVVTRTSMLQLEFARRHVDTVKNVAAGNEKLNAFENKFELNLFDWYDQFVAIAVQALQGDVGTDLALAILSGELIVVGVITGPAAALVAAATSAVLAAKDANEKLRSKKRRKKEDEAIARVETALLLIVRVNGLSQNWLQILRTRR